MVRPFTVRKSTFLAALLTVTAVALVTFVWSQRTALRTRYYVYRLAHAKGSEQQVWAENAASMDFAAVPGLLGCLRRTDGRVCANSHAGLSQLILRWGQSDDLNADLACRLANVFPTLSAPGQATALELAVLILQTSVPRSAAGVIPAVTRLLAQVPAVADERVQCSALKLVRELLDLRKQSETVAVCQRVTRTGLSNEGAKNRIDAIRLAMRPGMELSESVVALLWDPVAEVRRAAMLMVGPEQAAINTDDLLRWLHDPDESVRRLCEKALRTRGLRDVHMKLGRLMTDAQPAARLRVLDLLPEVNDLEPGIWLRRLSHDSAPAVRAAAIRAAAEQTAVDLRDRIEQMAENDPCPTLRQLATFYLNAKRSIRAMACVKILPCVILPLPLFF